MVHWYVPCGLQCFPSRSEGLPTGLPACPPPSCAASGINDPNPATLLQLIIVYLEQARRGAAWGGVGLRGHSSSRQADNKRPHTRPGPRGTALSVCRHRSSARHC
uniref:Uncharacterized protein n=1 Tax=Knipowitschia caucasica TaxID=637954 RepID=A0AAV2M8P2_KNICA